MRWAVPTPATSLRSWPRRRSWHTSGYGLARGGDRRWQCSRTAPCHRGPRRAGRSRPGRRRRARRGRRPRRGPSWRGGAGRGPRGGRRHCPGRRARAGSRRVSWRARAQAAQLALVSGVTRAAVELAPRDRRWRARGSHRARRPRRPGRRTSRRLAGRTSNGDRPGRAAAARSAAAQSAAAP